MGVRSARKEEGSYWEDESEQTLEGPEELTLRKSGGKVLQAGRRVSAKALRWEEQPG